MDEKVNNSKELKIYVYMSFDKGKKALPTMRNSVLSIKVKLGAIQAVSGLR